MIFKRRLLTPSQTCTNTPIIDYIRKTLIDFLKIYISLKCAHDLGNNKQTRFLGRK